MITLAAGILAGIVTILPPGPGERQAQGALGQCYRAAAQSCAPSDIVCRDAAAAFCEQLFGDPADARARRGANLRGSLVRTSARCPG